MLVANGKALGGPPVRRFAPSPAYQFDGQQFSEPLRMLARLENGAPIDPLPFEDRRAVVQRMGQNVSLSGAPWNGRAVHPDESISLSEGGGHYGFTLGMASP